MARAYTSPGKTSSLLGAIFGTGTNGAYVEKLSNITKKIEGAFDESTGEMIVNTEWGSFDNSLKVLKLTKYDKELDAGSVNPGIQMFEKLISGMFLGEILRVVIVEMHKEVGLLRHENSSQSDLKSSTFVDESSPLHTAWGVDSSVLSIAQADNSVGLRALRQELKTLFSASGASLEDAEAIKTIAAAIAKRAARLAGSAIAGIVLETGRLKITDNTQVIEEDIVDIGVDGSLVEFYPGFEDLIREALRAVNEIGPEGEKRIRIGIAKDGSGVGAALIALVADKSMLISPDFPFFFKKKLLT
jgi:hexokinase